MGNLNKKRDYGNVRKDFRAAHIAQRAVIAEAGYPEAYPFSCEVRDHSCSS